MKNIITYSIIMLLLCVVVAQCNGWQLDNKRNALNLEKLQDRVQYFKNRNGDLTASIGTLQLDNRQLQELVIDKDSAMRAMAAEFARVKSVVKVKTVTKFDTIQMAFDAPITPQSFDSLGYFERFGAHFGKWYSLGYKVTPDSLHVNEFTTWTDTRIMTGVKRKWLFGRETITTDITNSNPHIEVTDLQGAEFIVPTPWYKKWYVWLAAGAVGGVLIAK